MRVHRLQELWSECRSTKVRCRGYTSSELDLTSNVDFPLIIVEQRDTCQKTSKSMLTRQQLISATVGVFCIGASLAGYWIPRPTEAVPTTPKCPDLSGRYMIQGEDGQVYISIEQKLCDRASIRREIGYLGTKIGEKHLLKLDGTVQEDPQWFGEAEPYKTSAEFNDSALHIEARGNSRSTLTMIYSLTPEGDLLEEVFLNGRGAGSAVAKRVGGVPFFESNRQR